jgi:hypothetical protein
MHYYLIYCHLAAIQFGGRAFCMSSLAAGEIESGKRMSNSTIRSPWGPPFGFGKPRSFMLNYVKSMDGDDKPLIYRCVLPGLITLVSINGTVSFSNVGTFSETPQSASLNGSVCLYL